MIVTPDVLAVLDVCDTDGRSLRLPGSLERPLYLRTDKVLQAAGGKWSRGAKAHVFAGGPAGLVPGAPTMTFNEAIEAIVALVDECGGREHGMSCPPYPCPTLRALGVQ